MATLKSSIDAQGQTSTEISEKAPVAGSAAHEARLETLRSRIRAGHFVVDARLIAARLLPDAGEV